MKAAHVLLALLSFGILTLWVPERWPTAVVQTGAFALGIFVLIRWMHSGRPLRWAAVSVVPVFVSLWGLLQLAAGSTIYAWETWNAVLAWAANGVLFFVSVEFFRERSGREIFLRGTLHFGFALSVISTLQMFTSGGRVFWLFPSGYSDTVLGPFVYRNQYAAFIELIFPVALYFALHDTARRRLYVVMAGVMFASVIASASRTGSALVALEIPAVFLIASVGRHTTASIALRRAGQLAVAASVLALVVGVEVLWARFEADDPFAVRREILVSSLDMIRERPGMGFGLGTWASAYPAHASYDDGTFANQAHNDWAQWAVEGGLPVAVALLGMVLACLPAAIRSVWGIGAVSLFIHALVDYPMQQRPALAAVVFVFLGAIVAAASADRRRLRHADHESAGCGQYKAP